MRTQESTVAKLPDRHESCPIRLDDLAQALDYSDEGFALTDPEGNYIYINDAHLRMYGYERAEDLLGRSWRTLYTSEWVRHFEQAVLPIIPRDKVWRGQVVGLRREGSPFLAGVTLTLLPDGKITCNCRDESAKGTDRAPAHGNEHSALHELGERLIAGLPARFRRPLEMMNGYASFLLAEVEAGRCPDPKSLREGLGEIDAAGRRLAEQMQRLDLVAELAARDAFGPEGPGAPGADWPARLMRACRSRVASAGREADLEVAFGHGEPALDYLPLETVVLELLNNALQSSRTGEAVRIEGRREQGSYLFRFCDEGVGMTKACLDATGTRPFGQSAPAGFGLSVVRFIVLRAGGVLELDGDAPSTTCLRLTVPLR